MQLFKQMYRSNNEYQQNINKAHEKLISTSHRLNRINHHHHHHQDEDDENDNDDTSSVEPLEQQYNQLRQMYKEALVNTEKEQE